MPTWTRPPPPSPLTSRPTHSPSPSTLLPLLAYFTLNLALTLYNKLVLNRFPFPYTLTALHALCGTVGSWSVLHRASLSSLLQSLLTRFPGVRSLTRSRRNLKSGLQESPPKLSSIPIPIQHPRTPSEWTPLLLFSTLYTLNIVLSNVSLRLVTVPFHQCVRASAPVFVILIQVLIASYSPSPSASLSSITTPGSSSSNTLERSRRNTPYPPPKKLLALLPVIAGVALATYGDYYFTWPGFALTLAGTALAALKTVVTGVLVGRGEGKEGGGGKGKDRVEKARGDLEKERERDGTKGEWDAKEKWGGDEEKNPILFAHTPHTSPDQTLPTHTDLIYSTSPLSSPSPSSSSPFHALPPHHTTQSPQEYPHPQNPNPKLAAETKPNNKEEEEDHRLYPPHQLSPKAPFRFPSPLPSRAPSPQPVSQTSSSGSSSSGDAKSGKRTRPLSLSAFKPGPPIEDSAPSIPLPPPSTSASASVYGVERFSGPCPSSHPSSPLTSTCTATPTATPNTNPNTNPNKTTNRRSPPSFYNPHVHSPSVSFSYSRGYYEGVPFGGEWYRGYEGACDVEPGGKEVEDGMDGSEGWDGDRNGKGKGWKSKGWGLHRSTPSRVFVSTFSTLRRKTYRLACVARAWSTLLRNFTSESESDSSLRTERKTREMETWDREKERERERKPRFTYTPLQLLYLLSPLAFIQCVALAYFTGELERVSEHLHELSHLSPSPTSLTYPLFASGPFSPPSHFPLSLSPSNCFGARTFLLLNGALAFLLNVSSFAANRRVGPVGMSVAANTKQALAVVLSVAVFEVRLGGLNALGVGMALVGGGVYAWPG